MVVLTFTIYWEWFVNHHNALGQRNQVIPDNEKTRKMKKHAGMTCQSCIRHQNGGR